MESMSYGEPQSGITPSYGEPQGGITPEQVVVSFGDRVRKGYDPSAVDRHLQNVAAGVAALRSELAAARAASPASAEPDESAEMVLKATRRSVEEALAEARTRADAIVAEATAEAEAIRASARVEADTEVQRRQTEYAELAGLLDVRRTELAGLDAEISTRQQRLRDAAADLSRLADGFADEDEPAGAPSGPSLSVDPAPGAAEPAIDLREGALAPPPPPPQAPTTY